MYSYLRERRNSGCKARVQHSVITIAEGRVRDHAPSIEASAVWERFSEDEVYSRNPLTMPCAWLSSWAESQMQIYSSSSRANSTS